MQSFVKNCGALVLITIFSLLQPSCKNKEAAPKTASPKKDTVMSLSGNPYQSIDQSPMDITYLPADYPQNKMKGIATGRPVARIIYSRPHKKGRIIFSDNAKSLCQFGKPWRLGANESTEIEFFQPVMIGGKNIDAGRYVLYCIPHADKWEIVLNTNLDSWGLQIEPAQDVFKTEVPVQIQSPNLEDFTMQFQETTDGADLLVAWDAVKILMPITFSK